MRISDTIQLAGLTWLVSITALQADTATFATSKGKLTGTLQTIGEDGIIEWQSPYSTQPLKLLADKLEQIEFSGTSDAAETSPILLTLRNGDVIPAAKVTGLDDQALLTQTPIAGALNIPRAALASAQFGVSSQEILYRGFDNIRDWTSGKGEPDNWKRRGNSLISSGRSIAARDCELPEDFILSFGLSWDSRSPHYSISFADPLVMKSDQQNLYSFNFDGSGIRIVRHKAGDSRTQTLAQWQRRPSQFDNKSFLVELRVERSKRRMELFIDGESEGMIVDPMEEIPTGSGISISCRTHSGSQTISELTITEFNDIRTRHLAEKRGDPSLDCLITTQDDRWSGQLRTFAVSPKERLMIFETSFANEAWEIPESEVSTLFFANHPFKGGPGGEPSYLIEFHGKGRLSAKRCIISGDQVEMVHPLLGTLQIERSAIKLIRRVADKS